MLYPCNPFFICHFEFAGRYCPAIKNNRGIRYLSKFTFKTEEQAIDYFWRYIGAA